MNVISRIRQTHRVCGDALFIGNLPNPVTFTTSDPVRLPLPSPQHLGIHAACCKVARHSGAGEYSDKEDTRVLSFDGFSAVYVRYPCYVTVTFHSGAHAFMYWNFGSEDDENGMV
jgi:hypothetical protein